MRAETPGCNGQFTHLNNAGASLKPRMVVEAVARHLEREEEIGGYEAATEAAGDVGAFYASVARLINAQPSEIAFVDSATRGWQIAFLALGLNPGDEVLTSSAEYNSNMISFRHAEQRLGIRTVLVPDEADGSIDCAALERAITGRTRLISLSHMPTNDGIVQPAAEVGRIAKAHGIPYLLDACQSVGQMPIDVTGLGCTMLTATGRKYLRGPRGTGFLWVDRTWQDRLVPEMLDIRSARWTEVDRFEIMDDAGRYELWENNVAAQIGLGKAAAYAVRHSLDLVWERIQMLAARLRLLLAELPGFDVHDRGAVKSGIVTFSSRAVPAAELTAWLRREHAINTSVSAVQLTRTDLLSSGLTHVVRASVHAFNTEDEVDRLAAALRPLATGRDAAQAVPVS
ncbi:aminotransferase class V-fold PLP-dependent enzyme [Mesorhizobium sp. ZMM04-5]|uniref:Aminotransferase class V-fold PLP-dependent enzyme n=1 Tax=Mesorhizobium marinum TaxID=3228790 RepID=A0ABV3R1S9_9HYPH